MIIGLLANKSQLIGLSMYGTNRIMSNDHFILSQIGMGGNPYVSVNFCSIRKDYRLYIILYANIRSSSPDFYSSNNGDLGLL